jgi:hypothetical protein
VRKWIAALVTSLLFSAPTLVAGPLPGFAMVARSERLSCYARDGRRVDARKLDERLARFEQQLGQPAGHTNYYLYDYPEEVAVATGWHAGGVTLAEGDEVHTTSSASNHELVHVVGFRLGRPGAFFQEGLAVHLGDSGHYQGAAVDRVARRLQRGLPLSRTISQFDARQPGDGYALAGSFVGYLVKRHGLPQLAAFFRATLRNTPDAAFLMVYGQTLDQAGALWAASL